MKILAVSVSNHDASIALMADGELLTVFSCERTSREKHTGRVQQCDIDVIANYYTKIVDKLVIVNATRSQVDIVLSHVKAAGIKVGSFIVDNGNHHLFHAAASYYPLGMDDAICIVVDGAGSTVTNDTTVFQDKKAVEVANATQLTEVTSFFYANDDIKTLYKKFMYRSKIITTKPGLSVDRINHIRQLFPYPIDLTTHPDTGQMYGTITRYIGWSTMDAGKTMGLSAYGKPNNLPPILIPGTTLTNNNLFRHDKMIDVEANPQLLSPSDKVKVNMAFNVQRALEVMFLDKVEKALTLATSKNIIISGGCALNILGNSLIKKKYSEHNVYAEPIGTDSAQSLGAAYYYYKKHNPGAKFKKFNNLYYGPYSSVQRLDIDRLVKHYNEPTLQINSNNI